jgi:hypothetical protein
MRIHKDIIKLEGIDNNGDNYVAIYFISILSPTFPYTYPSPTVVR